MMSYTKFNFNTFLNYVSAKSLTMLTQTDIVIDYTDYADTN